ncbi:12544_t:CDS:1, partial [Entrophospora sp. SA101]
KCISEVTTALNFGFHGGCDLACSNACISKLLFTIIMSLKVDNKRTRDLVCNVYGDSGILA